MGFPGGSEVKASAWNAGDPSLIPGSGKYPGEGNGNPLQYSCLENPMEEEGNGNPLQYSCLENPMEEEGNGNPLQCSCLENPMKGRAW